MHIALKADHWKLSSNSQLYSAHSSMLVGYFTTLVYSVLRLQEVLVIMLIQPEKPFL